MYTLLKKNAQTNDRLQTRKFFALSHEDKMTAKHPPESTPNRGYSYVGQESVSNISGFEKGLPQEECIRDIKVFIMAS